MTRSVAYVFLYKNGIKERSVGIVKRYGTAEQPEVALELFGEEVRRKWRIFYLTKEEALCEAAHLWGRTRAHGRSQASLSECRLCAEAGMGAGVVLLPEEALSSDLSSTNLREFLCARYDGRDMTKDMLLAAVSRKPEPEETEHLCIESAKKLMEEITRAAGGEGEMPERGAGTPEGKEVQGNPMKEEKPKHRPRKQMTYLEELLFVKPPYVPCRQYAVEYSVRIAPEDLLSMPKKDHDYGNNSYLLHSYYRYRHLLLGRRRTGEKETYVLLVPGTYSEKEARLAALFGFPEFLPVAIKKPETGNAASGKEVFGYFCGKI